MSCHSHKLTTFSSFVLYFEVPGTSSENITESNEQLYIICVKIAINELKKIVMLSDLINKTVEIKQHNGKKVITFFIYRYIYLDFMCRYSV